MHMWHFPTSYAYFLTCLWWVSGPYLELFSISKEAGGLQSRDTQGVAAESFKTSPSNQIFRFIATAVVTSCLWIPTKWMSYVFLWICFGIYQGIHNLPSLFGRCPRNPKKLSIYALLENYFFLLNIAKTSGDFFKAYNLDSTNDKEGCKRTRTWKEKDWNLNQEFNYLLITKSCFI